MHKENVTNLVGKRLSDVISTHSSSATLLGNRISRSRGSLHSCTGVFPCLFTSVKSASCSISNLVMANVGSLGGSCKDNNMHEKLVKMKHIVGSQCRRSWRQTATRTYERHKGLSNLEPKHYYNNLTN